MFEIRASASSRTTQKDPVSKRQEQNFKAREVYREQCGNGEKRGRLRARKDFPWAVSEPAHVRQWSALPHPAAAEELEGLCQLDRRNLFEIVSINGRTHLFCCLCLTDV